MGRGRNHRQSGWAELSDQKGAAAADFQLFRAYIPDGRGKEQSGGDYDYPPEQRAFSSENIE